MHPFDFYHVRGPSFFNPIGSVGGISHSVDHEQNWPLPLMNSAPTLRHAIPLTTSSLPRSARLIVLAAAFGALLFDGVELGLMPVCSLSVAKNLLGEQFTV